MVRKVLKSFSLLVILSSLLCSCSTEPQPTAPNYSDQDAIYKLAWQYILNQEETAEAETIASAAITRLELVETYAHSNDETVAVYALEYSLYKGYDVEEERTHTGWIPGATISGSPYLFVKSEENEPVLIGVKSTKEVLQAESLETATNEVVSNGNSLSYEKSSTVPDPFTQKEVEGAINAVKDSQTAIGNLVINVWYDQETFLSLFEQYKENPLYGMDNSAENGNLIILCSDLLTFDDPEGMVFTGFHFIVVRDNKGADWKIVDQGY